MWLAWAGRPAWSTSEAIDSVTLQRGMSEAEVIRLLGPPEGLEHYGFDEKYKALSYGPFGAYDAKLGHVTRHRLVVTVGNGKVLGWTHGRPLHE